MCKTWTSTNHSKSKIDLSNLDTLNLISTNLDMILANNNNNFPILIDEWQNEHKIWDFIRNRVDLSNKMKNLF